MPRLFFPDQPGTPPEPPAGTYGQPQQPFHPPRPPERPAPPRPPNHPPARPPARARGTRPDRELRQRALAALVFGVVSLLALLWLGASVNRAMYLLLFSVIIGAGGCAIGISALVKARRTGSYRPRGAVAGIVLGALGTLFAGAMLLAFLMYPGPLRTYLNCVSVAHTQTAQQACRNSLYHSTGLRP